MLHSCSATASTATRRVDVRVLQVDGRWIASADTPDGPSLGSGAGPFEARREALQPFEGVMDELLASMPAFEPPAS